MLHERTLLRPVRRAVRADDDVPALRERVCVAAVDAGYRYAYVYDGADVLAAAGTDTPTPPAEHPAPADVETVSAPEGEEVLVPVTDGTAGHGTLAVAASDELTDSRREYLRTLGATIGNAIARIEAERERDRLETEVENERRQFQKLHSVAAQMVSCEDEESIYHLAIDAAENILDFDMCTIDVADDGYLVPVAMSTGMTEGDSERIPADEGIAGETYQSTSRIVVDDVSTETDAQPANPDYRSVLSVPIEGIGVFQAASESRAAFSDRDAELAELLMAHVAETLRRLWSDEALRESEQKYRTLIEQSHDAVTIHQDGAYEFVNRSATELFGRPRDDLLETDVWSVVHADDHEKLLDLGTAEGDALGDQRTFEARIERPDGDVRHCEFSTTVITYEGAPAVLASIRDITERKERERELERQNERLDEFASVVSHDLRSPLNVARGSIDLARESGEEEDFDRAEEALDRMEALVEDVLELARQGQYVDETEPVVLADIVREAWTSVDAPEGVLNVDVGDERVAADRGRLQELFENLFRNSVEHSSTSPGSQASQDADERGGDAVTVCVSSLPDGFAVTDDGPGIEEGEHDEVFERGYTSREEGTGFGLAIVGEIADAHDWTVEAVPPADDEAESRGARFEVTGVTHLE